MSIFIKAGLWIERKLAIKGEFNLTSYIKELIADAPAPTEGNFIPLTGTTIGNPVSGDIIEFDNIGGLSQITTVDKTIIIGSSNDRNLNDSSKFGQIILTSVSDNNAVAMLSKSSTGDFVSLQVISNEEDIPIVKINASDIYGNVIGRGLSSDFDFSPNITNLDYTQKIYVDQAISDSRPYKVYTALLTQTGTNAPTAVVLENTLGGTIVWARVGTGAYSATLTGAFSNYSKVYATAALNDMAANAPIQFLSGGDANTMYLYNRINASTGEDNFYSFVEIRVYN